jgi:tRNA G18 (ribose-2'-O)-methylase SpoU
MLVRRAKTPSYPELSARTTPSGLIVALDHVGNPHNAGAILRTAAFFGARGLVIGGGSREALAPAALRVAEGGAEHVPIVHVEDLTAALKGLRALGLTIVGADNSAKQTTHGLQWPARCVLVLGHEREGLSPAARKLCDERVRIPGSAAIDSLNVSVAAGVLIAGYAAAHGPR